MNPGDMIRINFREDPPTGIIIDIIKPQEGKSPWWKYVLLTDGIVQEFWLHTNEMESIEVLCGSER